MSFWQNTIPINLYPKASLQACHKSNYPNICDSSLNPKSSKRKRFKRTFYFALPSLQGSMCVEAAVSFSLFLFFLTNVFSLIFLFIHYAENMESLQQRGKEMAVYAYTAGSLYEDNNELIVLKDWETIESPFPLLAMPSCRLVSQCVIKPWTGYCVTTAENREKEEELVYMTEYGEVYHRSRSCSHLALSVRIAVYDSIETERNENGARYYPCEYCGNHSFSTVAFLTSQGNRYHSTINCRGLKRTIRSVYISEVTGTSACQKCG